MNPIETKLRKLFSRYTTENLVGISPEAFQQHIVAEIGRRDYILEGYRKDEVDAQRDLSIRFVWGHNHDFGTFKLDGQMGDRHFILIRNFCEFFGVKLEHFEAKEILDVGCWTGGTTLMLAAMGAQVSSMEEVRKYAAMAEFLIKSFGLRDHAGVAFGSLYAWENPWDFYDAFDIIFFPGVLYHLSDPVLALRILFNACKVGGEIFLESMGTEIKESICTFEGSRQASGSNWFVPSLGATIAMMEEAGWEDVRTHWEGGRVYAHAVKHYQKPICRAGLSVSEIR